MSGLLSQLENPALQTGAQSKLPGAPPQLVLPCALLQVLPQDAQLLAVPSVVSQPAAAVQSAKPALHVPMVQVPDGHDAAALGNEQGTPHPPQLLTAKTFVSQPLLALLSQLMKPAAQVGAQAKLPGEPEQVVPP